MKKYLISSAMLLSLALLSGCGKEELSTEYNMVNIKASSNIASELSEVIVTNTSFDKTLEVFKKYSYLIEDEIYYKNFDLDQIEVKYNIAFNLDDSQYISKSEQQSKQYGITKEDGTYAIYIKYIIDISKTTDSDDVVDLGKDTFAKEVFFEYKFDSNNKLIDYNMTSNDLE